MTQKITLAGTPNCGKTTFWNRTTGRREKTGNWSGVTTKNISAFLKDFPDTKLTDLPGIYSLSSNAPEEKTAIDYLESNKKDPLIILIDGTKPEQGLFLVLELIELKIPSVLGINFADELTALGINVDIKKLSENLGIPVFLISAKKGKNVDSLLKSAMGVTPPIPGTNITLSLKSRREKAAFLAKKCFSKAHSLPNNIHLQNLFALSANTVLIIMFLACLLLKSRSSALFEHTIALLSALMNYCGFPAVLKSVVSDALLPGIASVLSFLPELSILFFILSFLEDSGYMARFAFFFDFLFKKIGLSGRSVIPLLLGFGCTISAVCAAESSGSKDARHRVLSMLMFVPCSARLPLMVLMCETFFRGYAFAAILLFYIFTIAVGIVLSYIQNSRKGFSFFFELPKIRIPSIKSTLKITYNRLKSFVEKAGLAIVLTSLLLWVLKNRSIFLEPVLLQSESALAFIGGSIAPFFAPIGIPYEGVIALFCGLFAKESSLFALIALCDDISALFSPISAFSFLIFYLIYTPCLACLFSIANEFGIKKAVRLFLRQTALAYLFSFVFYQIALLIQNIFIP